MHQRLKYGNFRDSAERLASEIIDGSGRLSDGDGIDVELNEMCNDCQKALFGCVQIDHTMVKRALA